MYKSTSFWKEYIIYLNKCKINNTTPKSTSQWIKFHRLQHGWSQMDLAIKLELTETQGRYLIKDYETRGLYPPQELSIRLSKLFNIGTKYFYDEYYEFLDMDYPNIIKNYRLENNLSKTKLAKLLSTTYETIIRWEKGENISRQYYKKLNKLMQLTTKEP
ncbi:helix-turn-helix domain-containing protein [Clostridium botulinum]|uniref:XRE family transcriptional regulator n=2 Tax=Clostridium botulinum TaxID=1491 RepID=M1ZQC9_CLOBO|nr:helix-turn-helix transcriptional regulator [Clostridium botulinum]EKN41236.1 XRE family transcriptional regulator [Clostridium botulinum CFSAN001627]